MYSSNRETNYAWDDGHHFNVPLSSISTADSRSSKATVKLKVLPNGKTFALPLEKVATEEGFLSNVPQIGVVKSLLAKWYAAGHPQSKILYQLLEDGIWDIENEEGEVILLQDWARLVGPDVRFSLNTNETVQNTSKQPQRTNANEATNINSARASPSYSYSGHPRQSEYVGTRAASNKPQSPGFSKEPSQESTPFQREQSSASSYSDSGYSSNATNNHYDGGVPVSGGPDQRFPPLDRLPKSFSKPPPSVASSSRSQSEANSRGPGRIRQPGTRDNTPAEAYRQETYLTQRPTRKKTEVNDAPNAVVMITAYSEITLPCVYPPPPGTKQQKCSFSPKTVYWKALKSLAGGGNSVHKLQVLRIAQTSNGEKWLAFDYHVEGARDETLADKGFTVDVGQNQQEYIVMLV